MTEPRYPVVLVEVSPEESDLAVGLLSMHGAEAIEERDATTLTKGGAAGVTLIASFSDEAAANAAVEALGGRFPVRVEAVVGDAWRDAWKEHWQPTRITPRVVIVPNWVEYSPAAGDLVMRLDPGRAFGTGQHPSTALAARAMERYIAEHGAPSLVIDLGCGSGILAFVGLMEGVPRAIGCDIDEGSVTNAVENAQGLGLADRFECRVGGFETVPETAPLVVANIEAMVLVPMAEKVVEKVAPGGALVLSGILAEQREMVETAYRAQGFDLVGCELENGWISPVFRWIGGGSAPSLRSGSPPRPPRTPLP